MLEIIIYGFAFTFAIFSFLIYFNSLIKFILSYILMILFFFICGNTLGELADFIYGDWGIVIVYLLLPLTISCMFTEILIKLARKHKLKK
jgi:VIT1/CCC1 family predicted Fe2+/Mn2+ transporter